MKNSFFICIFLMLLTFIPIDVDAQMKYIELENVIDDLNINSNSEFHYIENNSNVEEQISNRILTPKNPATLTIDNVYGQAGTSISVTVNAQSLNNLVGFQWILLYDPSKLTYVSCSNWATGTNVGGIIINSSTPGVIRLVGNNFPAMVNIANGKFFDINFNILPGVSGTANLTWSDAPPTFYRELSDNLAVPIVTTWIDGSVKIGPTLDIADVNGIAGTPVIVPVNVENLSGVVGFQWTVDYDETKLTYASCSNWAVGVNTSSLIVFNDAINGKLTFCYNDDPYVINTGTGTFFDLNFNILPAASGVAAVNWSSIPTIQEISNAVPEEIIATWVDGSVTITAAASPVLDIDDVNGIAGSPVVVPVYAENLSGLVGFQWTVDYDETKLTYASCSNWAVGVNTSALVVFNDAINGKLTFGYNDDPNEINIVNGIFFNLNFNILPATSGVAAINWSSIPTTQELSNTIPAEIIATWVDGSVTISAAASPILDIDDVNGVAGSPVIVPVYAENLSGLVGFQWTIDYDETKLTYASCSNWAIGVNTSALIVFNDAINGKLTFGYNDDPNEINIVNGTFFDLNFNILPATSGVAAINWSSIPTTQELSNTIPAEIIATWVDGSVTIISDIYWDGSTSIDWQDITNWTPEFIPTNVVNAIIPALCPNYPVIDDNATTAECLNLQIDAGSSVTIATNGQMTVYGTITNTQGADGLIIQSDATGDGSLIQTTGAVPATVQRYMSASKWHFLFSPLSALPVTVLTGGINPNFYFYNEANADYWNATLNYGSTGWTTVATANCELDKGYILYHTSNMTYTLQGGNLLDADKTFNVSYNVSGAGNVTVPVLGDRPWSIFDGWMLVGNPYTAAVDWNLVTLTDIESGIYFYDGTNYRYYMQGGNGTQVPPYDLGISLNGGSQFIPAGQGFFVKTTNTGSTHTGTFTIPKTARAHSNQPYYKENVVIPDLLRLHVATGTFADETVVRSLLEATDNHNPEFDAYKMYSWNKTVPQIYTLNDNNNAFAINTLPIIESYKQVRMGFYSGESGDYSINVTELNYTKTRIYLEDNYNDVLVYLNEIPDYTFYSETGTFEDRFILHFNPNTIPYTTGYIPDQETFVGTDYQYTIPDGLFFDVDADENLTYVATLVSGNSLPSWLTFNTNDLSFSGVSDMPQILEIIVTATDIFGESVSDIFELNVKNTTNVIENKDFEIEIFPVPALDKVYLSVGGTVKNYKVEINSMSGKNIYTSSFSNKETNVINLDLFASGVYSLTITFEDNYKIIRKLIIQ